MSSSYFLPATERAEAELRAALEAKPASVRVSGPDPYELLDEGWRLDAVERVMALEAVVVSDPEETESSQRSSTKPVPSAATRPCLKTMRAA